MSSVPLNWKDKVSSTNEQRDVRGTWARWTTFIAIVVIGAAADLVTKQVVFVWRGLPGTSEPWWLVEGYIGIETAVNPGALFGMGAGFGLVFAALSVVAAAGIFIWLAVYRAIESWWMVIALACVMGGIFGNLYDRLGLWDPPASEPTWQSGVRDWILFRYQQHTWPNFNIADSLLVCGAAMLAYHALFLMPEIEKKKAEQAAE